MAKPRQEYNLITFKQNDVVQTAPWRGTVCEFNKANRNLAIVYSSEIDESDFLDLTANSQFKYNIQEA